MEREQIIAAANSLPEIPIGDHLKEEDVFEGTENGAHFILTRNSTTAEEKPVSFWALTLSGSEQGKESLKTDFIQALGKPFEVKKGEGVLGLESISWLISTT